MKNLEIVRKFFSDNFIFNLGFKLIQNSEIKIAFCELFFHQKPDILIKKSF